MFNFFKRSSALGFLQELNFWDLELSLEGQFKEHIVNRINQDKAALPSNIMEYVKLCTERNGAQNLVTVLDVGCGALSKFGYGHKEKLFNLTCCDPLAKKYKALHKKYKYSVDYPMVQIGGEKLTKTFAQGIFDIVWMQNALDHSQNPSKVMEQLFAVCSAGGFIVIQGYSREGTRENFAGLHQHDLYIHDGHLYCETLQKDGKLGEKYILDDIKGMKIIEVSETNNTDKPKWFSIKYQKEM